MYILSFSNTSQFYKSLPYPDYDLFIRSKNNGFKYTTSITKSSPYIASPVESGVASIIESIYSYFLIKTVFFSPSFVVK